MGKITEAHRELIKEVGLSFVATASKDGAPNVSPKGSIAVLDDDHLMFAEIMSPGTRANLRENQRIAVMVCKLEGFQGFQFKGIAEVFPKGEFFDQVSQMMKERAPNLPTPQNAVKIKVEEVRALGEAPADQS